MTNEELVQEYKNGDMNSLAELINRFSSKMKYICFTYSKYATWYGLDIQDLEQEGWIGFIKALDTYEAKSDCSFFSFIKIPVTYSILKAIRKNKPLGYKNKGHSELKYLICSMDSPLNNSADLTLHDVISVSNDKSEFEHQNYILTLRHDLLTLLNDVFSIASFKTISAQEVLLLHYGLYGKAMTLAEIANMFNKTASYIGEIENQAINKIRNSIHGKAFLGKYKDEHSLFLQNKKEGIDLMKNPETINVQLDSINLLIQKFCEGQANNNG